VLERPIFDAFGCGVPLDFHIVQISCLLAAAWLKLREDAFIDLRFEVVDALINTVKFLQLLIALLKPILDIGTRNYWLHDIGFNLDLTFRS
jgi:hypothetical protein